MSILDAKDLQSWQIGFEDGVKFMLKRRAEQLACHHVWRDADSDKVRVCQCCSIERHIFHE